MRGYQVVFEQKAPVLGEGHDLVLTPLVAQHACYGDEVEGGEEEEHKDEEQCHVHRLEESGDDVARAKQLGRDGVRLGDWGGSGAEGTHRH